MRTSPLIALLIAVPLLLAGCSTGSNFSGAPGEWAGEIGGDEDGSVQAYWLHEGTELAITISGSSGCPSIVSGLRVLDNAQNGNRIAADVPLPDPARACTADYVPHTTVFYTPGQVTTTQPLIIEVLDQKIVLPIK